MIDSPWADLAAHADLPRITGLAASVGGARLVATVERPDVKRSTYVPSLWSVPLDGGAPERLTWSEQGEDGHLRLPLRPPPLL